MNINDYTATHYTIPTNTNLTLYVTVEYTENKFAAITISKKFGYCEETEELAFAFERESADLLAQIFNAIASRI